LDEMRGMQVSKSKVRCRRREKKDGLGEVKKRRQ